MCGDTLSSDPIKRLAYNVAVALFAYMAPLLTIFYCYFRILYVLHKRSDRKTFRFAKCSINANANPSEINQSRYRSLSKGSKRYSRGERTSLARQSLVQEEINSHNTRTITRAKLKTLKLTILIGEREETSTRNTLLFSCYL